MSSLISLTKTPLQSSDGTLFIITMKNGENRIDTAFCQAMFTILDEIEAFCEEMDGTPAALITTSEGKFYSNGLDLEHAISTPGFFENYYLALLERFLTFRIPTVAALNGHAFAGGCMMALAHDYRVMRSDRGFLCMNEVDIPSPLHPGMAALVRAKTTPSTYRNCVLQGYRFTAQDALDNQLVDVICPEREVLSKAIEIATKWSDKAKAGEIYRQLKREMYTDAIHFLTLEKAKL